MSAFTDSIEHYCEGLHVAPGSAACCTECRDAYGIDDDMPDDEAQELMQDEGSFSWSQCDSCGSTFGGDRHDAHGLPIDARGALDYSRDLIHLSICTDCLLFHANGDEPERWSQHPGARRTG